MKSINLLHSLGRRYENKDSKYWLRGIQTREAYFLKRVIEHLSIVKAFRGRAISSTSVVSPTTLVRTLLEGRFSLLSLEFIVR